MSAEVSHPTRRTVLVSALASAASAACSGLVLGDDGVVLDDASRLDPTPVARHVVVKPDAEAAIIENIRSELRDAAAAGRPVALGVARHSMGGQSLARGGTAFTFDTPVCSVDTAAGIYRVQAGTRWRDVIAALDPLELSPVVMQSNNDFGVASTYSVNAHGWAVPHGPFGTTVRSLRMMLADGSIVRCSRSENDELFRQAMGGYGLFGVILDLDLEATPNILLEPTFEPLPSVAIGTRFMEICADTAVKMAYGRLNVAKDSFLADALMVSYRPHAMPAGRLPPVHAGGVATTLTREVYRAEINSDLAKRFRWFMETVVGPRAESGPVTRNMLLNEAVAALAGHDLKRTDILHEYFVPPERFVDFLSACREVIPKAHQELLNVTLRFVAADNISVLAYAPTARIAAVMSFSQALTPDAEADMQRMTQDLIERILTLGGTFYLPYRLHARRDQVARAYLATTAFADCKRRYDPRQLFRNAMWDKWFADA